MGDHGGIIFAAKKTQLDNLRQAHRRSIDPLGCDKECHAVAATGQSLARDEAVGLGVGVQAPIGPAAHRRRFSTQPAHNLADFAFRTELDAELNLLIRDRLRLAGRELALQVAQHVVDAARHPGRCAGA